MESARSGIATTLVQTSRFSNCAATQIPGQNPNAVMYIHTNTNNTYTVKLRRSVTSLLDVKQIKGGSGMTTLLVSSFSFFPYK